MKLDLRMLYLKSWKCSLNLIWNEHSVWPIYFTWQSGHMRLYTPLRSYCCWDFWLLSLGVSCLLIVLLTLYATHNCVFF